MDRPRVPVPLVGIMGSGRSGSTLLEFLLAGHLDGARALGEVETLAVRALQHNEVCSCTAPALDCPRWTTVVQCLAADPGRAAWETAVEDRRQRLWWAVRLYAAVYWRVLTRRSGAETRVAMDRYAAVVAALAAAADRPGPLVDNSKTPLHFVALAATGRVDVRVIHLVRRPQAVVWSWRRRKHLPESGSRNWYMEPKPVVVSAARWLFDALMAAWLPVMFPAVPFVRVTYDDVCADPSGTAQRCAAALDLTAGARPGAPSDYHVLGGNPARFDGFRRIEREDEWRTHLAWPARMALVVVASPVYRLLARGGRRRA